MTAPALPDDREWHPYTLEWWQAWWASPMAPEFDQSDALLGLRQLAVMVNDWWALDEIVQAEMHDGDPLPAARLRTNLSAEIRLQGQRFGTSPLDRSRLHWNIDMGESAERRTRQRRNETATTVPAKTSRTTAGKDPRMMLYDDARKAQ